MGCPVHKVTRGGGGSAMMCDPAGTVDLVRTVVEAVRIPVTVKMRLGWDDAQLSAPFFAREFEQAGVAAVTIHGRTRAQGFGGTVNLDGIRAVVEAVERIPVIGNGDVRTLRRRRADACATPAAPASPSAAGRCSTRGSSPSSSAGRRPATRARRRPTSERLDFMDRHFRLLVEHRGERFGCLTFRKVANWYCRVLRPGREVQQRLVRLESVAEFDEIVARAARGGAARGWQRLPEAESADRACRAGRSSTGDDHRSAERTLTRRDTKAWGPRVPVMFRWPTAPGGSGGAACRRPGRGASAPPPPSAAAGRARSPSRGAARPGR